MEDKDHIVPDAAKYHAPCDTKLDVSSFDGRMSGLERRLNEEIGCLKSQQNVLSKTVQQLRDEMIDTQKRLRQFPLHEKMLDVMTEQLDEISQTIILVKREHAEHCQK